MLMSDEGRVSERLCGTADCACVHACLLGTGVDANLSAAKKRSVGVRWL